MAGKCIGCGIELQSEDVNKGGNLPAAKLEEPGISLLSKMF